MDPAAFSPSEELREDIIYSVENLLNLWMDHSGEEFHRAEEVTATDFQSSVATGIASCDHTGFSPQHATSSPSHNCFAAQPSGGCSSQPVGPVGLSLVLGTMKNVCFISRSSMFKIREHKGLLVNYSCSTWNGFH